MKRILITSLFFTEDKVRQNQYNECLQKNIDNTEFDQIIILYLDLNEDVDWEGYPLLSHEKIKVEVMAQERITFSDIFKYTKVHHPKDIIVLCNSDIYYDDTAKYINPSEKEFWGIARLDFYDKEGKWKLIEDGNNGSYDTWSFIGDIKQFDDIGIKLGIMGCDSLIIKKARVNGYITKNPALTIKTYHNDEPDISRYKTNYRPSSILKSGKIYHDHEEFPKGTEFFPPATSECLIENITILIKTFKRPKCCYRLLRSIRLRYPTVKMILADDSGDKYFDEYAYHVSNTQYLKLPKDVGLSAGRKKLVEACKTKYFMMCDDDFVFTDNTDLESAIVDMINSEADVLQGKFINRYSDGTTEDATRSFSGQLDLHGREKNREPVGLYKGFYRFDFILNFFIGKTNQWKRLDIIDESMKIQEHLHMYRMIKFYGLKCYISNSFEVEHVNERPADYLPYRVGRRKELNKRNEDMLKEIEIKPIVVVMAHGHSRKNEILPVLQMLGWKKFDLTEDFQKISSHYLVGSISREEYIEKGLKLLSPYINSKERFYIFSESFINTLDCWQAHFSTLNSVLLYLKEDKEYLQPKLKHPDSYDQLDANIYKRYSNWTGVKLMLSIGNLINMFGEGAFSLANIKNIENGVSQEQN